MIKNHQEHINFIWTIANLLRGPYRPAQYRRVMLPMTVLRRMDCVLEPTKEKVLKRYEQFKTSKVKNPQLILNRVAGQHFHNISKFTFKKLFFCHKYPGEMLREIGMEFGIGESGVSQASRRIALYFGDAANL